MAQDKPRTKKTSKTKTVLKDPQDLVEGLEKKHGPFTDSQLGPFMKEAINAQVKNKTGKRQQAKTQTRQKEKKSDPFDNQENTETKTKKRMRLKRSMFEVSEKTVDDDAKQLRKQVSQSKKIKPVPKFSETPGRIKSPKDQKSIAQQVAEDMENLPPFIFEEVSDDIAGDEPIQRQAEFDSTSPELVEQAFWRQAKEESEAENFSTPFSDEISKEDLKLLEDDNLWLDGDEVIRELNDLLPFIEKIKSLRLKGLQGDAIIAKQAHELFVAENKNEALNEFVENMTESILEELDALRYRVLTTWQAQSFQSGDTENNLEEEL